MSLAEYFPEQIRELPAYEGQFDAFKLTAETCDVLFGIYPGGTVIEPHSHDTDNVGVITKGVLLLTMDGKTQRIEAGEWYFVPAGKPHAAEFPEDTADIELWIRR
jgi:quercetin dioxygenase-like cupin family protein